MFRFLVWFVAVVAAIVVIVLMIQAAVALQAAQVTP